MPLNLKNHNLEKVKELSLKIFEFVLPIATSKYTIATIVWMFAVYFINPFWIFDSAELREQKLRAKTNEFIKTYVIETSEALEKIADSETSVQTNVSDINSDITEVENKICWLKSQFDSLEIDLNKTCWEVSTNSWIAVNEELIKEETQEVKKELASLANTIKYYKEDYPFEKFHYYTTATNVRKEFTDAMKKINWRLNKDLKAQDYVELKGNTVEERATDLLNKHGAPHSSVWFKTAEAYGIKAEVAICISKADSSLGQELTTANNFGNVWNNDRGDRVHFKTAEEWIAAISKVLVWKYLLPNKKVWELSNGWRANLWLPKCWAWNYCYATSEDNWNVNVLNCLSMIHNKPIDEDFSFRK